MKTNVNIIRKLNDFEVVQRTKDGYFDANALLNLWNNTPGSTRRRKDDFLNSVKTKEFIDALQEEIANGELSPLAFYEKKGRNTASGRNKDELWMHPYLFIDFAMWINPKFKVSVIKFVYDELIKHRHLSGDYYNKLSSLLSRFPETKYPEVAKALNYIVFNKHKRDIRNFATPEEQNDLQQLERDMCEFVERGYITSYKKFIETLQNEWRKRHSKEPNVFRNIHQTN